MTLSVFAASCTDNCRTLAERICSFFDGASLSGTSAECLSRVDQAYAKASTPVRWENEYRCEMFLKSCTREALELGEAQECGLSSSGTFSQCITNWHRSCDCVMGAAPNDAAACHTAAEGGQFTVEQSLVCGHQYRDSCTCEALKAGDCAQCGFSPCGPFSPCLDSWRTACDCVWGAFPERRDRCVASMAGTQPMAVTANPYYWAPAEPFLAEEDLTCARNRDRCTCESLANGDCSTCGFRDVNCAEFSPCHVLGYHLCECMVTDAGAQSVCKDMMDRMAYNAEDNASCAGSREGCTCETLWEPPACPGSMMYLLTPCRTLSYQVCGCPQVAAGLGPTCQVVLTGPGFDDAQQQECTDMKESCTCDAFFGGQGCPDVLTTRFKDVK